MNQAPPIGPPRHARPGPQQLVLWNCLYLDRAAKQLPADGFPVTDDLLAHLSPLRSTPSTSTADARSSGRRKPGAYHCWTVGRRGRERAVGALVTRGPASLNGSRAGGGDDRRHGGGALPLKGLVETRPTVGRVLSGRPLSAVAAGAGTSWPRCLDVPDQCQVGRVGLVRRSLDDHNAPGTVQHIPQSGCCRRPVSHAHRSREDHVREDTAMGTAGQGMTTGRTPTEGWADA